MKNTRSFALVSLALLSGCAFDGAGSYASPPGAAQDPAGAYVPPGASPAGPSASDGLGLRPCARWETRAVAASALAGAEATLARPAADGFVLVARTPDGAGRAVHLRSDGAVLAGGLAFQPAVDTRIADAVPTASGWLVAFAHDRAGTVQFAQYSADGRVLGASVAQGADLRIAPRFDGAAAGDVSVAWRGRGGGIVLGTVDPQGGVLTTAHGSELLGGAWENGQFYSLMSNGEKMFCTWESGGGFAMDVPVSDGAAPAAGAIPVATSSDGSGALVAPRARTSSTQVTFVTPEATRTVSVPTAMNSGDGALAAAPGGDGAIVLAWASGSSVQLAEVNRAGASGGQVSVPVAPGAVTIARAGAGATHLVAAGTSAFVAACAAR